jgi:hypothetical protein
VQARLRLPDLQAWHRLQLREEFRADRRDVESFADYLRLEQRLFDELRTRLMDDPQATDPHVLGRYHPGSAPARRALETPYNRSYELATPEPRGAVLLVHGLSDSPYSMRALAGIFHAQGYHVLVLRLPGHGTTPSMLRDVTWQDWYAAVALGAREAAHRAGPGRPFLAVGHSTGAALLALHAVRGLADFEPDLDQLDAGLDHPLLEHRAELEEAAVLLLAAEPHHELHAGPVVPAAVEDHDLAGGGKVGQVALQVELGLLAVRRRRQGDLAEDARADALGDRPDGASLAGGVPSFEHDDDP